MSDAPEFAANDKLTNLYTGMGAQGGRRSGDVWAFNRIEDGQLEAMYRTNWMAAKAVDIPADDMTSQWRVWQGTPEQATALDAAEKALNVVGQVAQALKWARLFGGAVLLVSDGAPDPSRPLDINRIKKGGLRYVLAMPRTLVAEQGELNWNPDAPNYGLPEFWTLRKVPGSLIHWTRVIVFRGHQYPDPTKEQDCFGDSILLRIQDDVRNAALGNESGAALLDEAKVDILKIENLAEHLQTAGSTQRLIERMALLRLGKGNFKLTLIGGKESLETKQMQFGNVDKILYYYVQVVSGAADIPVTRFLNQSPAGLSSTGDADLRNYATMIRAQQERALAPALKRLDQMLFMHALGSVPDELWYDWRSIWIPSPKESAETAKILAEGDAALMTAGLVPSEALEASVQARLIEAGNHPGLEKALREASPDPEPEEDPEADVDPATERAA